MTDTIESLAREFMDTVVYATGVEKHLVKYLTRARALGPEWLPVDDAAKTGEWFWTARAGTKLPMLAAYDESEGAFCTFNLALESATKKPWEPTHYMPIQQPPKELGQ